MYIRVCSNFCVSNLIQVIEFWLIGYSPALLSFMTFPCKIIQMMLKLHRHSLGMHLISRSPILANRIHATSVLLILHFVLSSAQLQQAPGSPQIPAIFAFGDSLIDSGNNNYLASVAKSNYWPYGCDFNRGPTGRFSNGKTIVDLLGKLLNKFYHSLQENHDIRF